MDMVSISSESGNEQEFAKYILGLGKKLKLNSKIDKYGNVYLLWKGDKDSIMLNTHLDTVSPGHSIKPKLSKNFITSDGKTILGADSKAGIAAMFEAIKQIEENKLEHKTVLITLTCNEESGIPTADKITSDIKTCIVPDRGTPIGEIIIQAPYAQVYEVEIKGKTAYAPISYNDGKHSIGAAIEMLKDLPMGNIDKDTTASVGIINGGLMTSMIPEFCKFKGSCYSFSKKSFDNFFKKLNLVVKKADIKFGTKSKITMLEYFGGYKIDKSDQLVQTTEEVIRKSGIKPIYKIYKAVTNANLLNQIGIKSILISTGVENQHTTREKISLDSLTKLTEIIYNLTLI